MAWVPNLDSKEVPHSLPLTIKSKLYFVTLVDCLEALGLWYRDRNLAHRAKCAYQRNFGKPLRLHTKGALPAFLLTFVSLPNFGQ